MSLLLETWRNFAQPLWERETVAKLDKHQRHHDAYGSVRINAEVLLPDYLAGQWYPLDFYTVQGAVPHNLSLNLDGTFIFELEGAYSLTLSGLFIHAKSNNDRDIGIRLFNVTQGAPGTGVFGIDTIAQSRGTNLSITTLFDISQTVVGDVFIVEMGGGDEYTSVAWESLIFTITSAGILSDPEDFI